MRVKTSVKVGINQYKEISHKNLIKVIGKNNFEKAMSDFKNAVQEGNSIALDYKVYCYGYVFYFEKVGK